MDADSWLLCWRQAGIAAVSEVPSERSLGRLDRLWQSGGVEQVANFNLAKREHLNLAVAFASKTGPAQPALWPGAAKKTESA